MKKATPLVCAIAICAFAVPALAQSNYPDRNIRLIVSFAPGGPTDVAGRIIAAGLQEKWGKNVIVENRGGAGGNIGTVAVARAEPDGYTILVTTSAFSVNLSYNANPGYGASDLKPVALVATTPNIIVGAPDLKADKLKEALELARAGNFSYASAGAGTTPHLSAERVFKLIGKLDVRHVPFTGAAPAMNAVSAGHVQFGVVAMTPAIELVKAGKLKGYAVTSAKRAAELPSVPTVTETGVGNIDDATWVAMFVPAKTPPAIAAKINEDVNALLKQPATVQQISKAGLDPLGGSLAEIETYVATETKKWADVIVATGAREEKKP
jgi:tripartite-type tricarboxylate transporter receptor subunit TctC